MATRGNAKSDLDIKEFTDEPHDPMIPHTFVFEPGLKIWLFENPQVGVTSNAERWTLPGARQPIWRDNATRADRRRPG
jgi:hypothetical protein